eukprot:CAMPEP_0197017098 /NCGR_PEP_ID=MMETSP1380-20130617/79349_1 /TAXON_ID=5936 /ORGANISM="Euplotes crassus, Strain CT5" /LENGTH=229 /DNA_ID=CAMNT_0042444155 /DNA_START=1587 /DNA_END=2277 /DNA_ORIENTATION=+
MDIEEICQLVPPVDKKLRNALKKLNKEKSDLKSQSSQKVLRDKDKGGSLIKQKQIKIRNKTASKKPETAKPKMVDAWTQTERSDFAIIKYKMQKKLQAKSLEKNKLNAVLGKNKGGSQSVVRASGLGSHNSLVNKMSTSLKGANSSAAKTKTHEPLMDSGIKNYSQMPIKMGFSNSSQRHGSESAKSQLTPGFSRNPIKGKSKRTVMHMNKKRKANKMRLPSLKDKHRK